MKLSREEITIVVRSWIGEREKIGLFEARNGCCCFGFEGSMEKVSNLNFDKV